MFCSSYWGNGMQSPLLIASIEGDEDIVKLLLTAKNIDTNQIDGKYGQTVLSIACEQGKKQIVQLLLEHEKIDINIKDKNGDAAIDYADINDQKDVNVFFCFSVL